MLTEVFLVYIFWNTSKAADVCGRYLESVYVRVHKDCHHTLPKKRKSLTRATITVLCFCYWVTRKRALKNNKACASVCEERTDMTTGKF